MRPTNARALLATAMLAAGALGGFGGGSSVGAVAQLKVSVSVPSVLAGNSRHLWLANTGTSSVLEFSTPSGSEVRNVGGANYLMDDSDAIVASGAGVWVANASSNTVTEFSSADGHLIRVLRAPTHRLEVPVAIAIAERHVFVLNKAGTRILVLSESTGKLVKVLGGPRYHFIHTAGMVSVRDDIWTANGGGKGTLTEISASTGRVLRVVAAGKGRLSTPVAITTDGTYLWVGNRAGNHLSELSAASGRFVRTLRIRDASLDAVTSISVANRVVWVARTGSRTLVIGVNSRTGRPVRCATHKFGFPAVFSDGRHIWVVDRTESRLSEVVALNGAVVRVISS